LLNNNLEARQQYYQILERHNTKNQRASFAEFKSSITFDFISSGKAAVGPFFK
jgi:hypothetical protein